MDSSGNLYTGSFLLGLFRSTDAGEHWSQLGPAYPTGIAVHPTGLLFVSTGSNLLVSRDQGQTWSVAYQSGSYVRSVFIDRRGRVYACLANKVVSSSDMGLSWLVGQPSQADVSCLAAGIDGEVFVGSISGGIFWSTDYGISWKLVSDGILRVGCTALLFAPDGSLLAATNGDGGIYRTIKKFGLRWTFCNIPNTYVNSLKAMADKQMLASTTTGVYRYLLAHGLWERTSVVWPTGTLAAASDSMVFVIHNETYGDNYVGCSTDAGVRWRWSRVADASLLLNAIAVAPNESPTVSKVTVFAAGVPGRGPGPFGSGVYKSTDVGKSWVETSLRANALSLECLPSAVLIAGTGDGVFVSSDEGESWVSSNSGLGGAFVYEFCTGVDGSIFAATNEGLFVAAGPGADWTATAMHENVLTLVVDHRDNIFAGGPSGLFLSTDQGNTWAIFTNGLRNTNVRALARDEFGRLYAGTQGGGVYMMSWPLSISDSSKERFPVTFSLDQNYPNPFNSNSEIRYHLPSLSISERQAGISDIRHIRLVVYDLLGREVATLVNEVEQPGIYTVEFDASNLASGVYLYRLKAGNFVETKRLVLLR